MPSILLSKSVRNVRFGELHKPGGTSPLSRFSEAPSATKLMQDARDEGRVPLKLLDKTYKATNILLLQRFCGIGPHRLLDEASKIGMICRKKKGKLIN